MEPTNSQITAQLEQMQARLARAERRARLSWACLLCALPLMLVVSLRPAALAQAPGTSLAALQAAIVALQQKTQFLSASSAAKTTTFTGCNVQIVDGTGSTPSTSGLGNLTIGYNETGNASGSDTRTGSHNLIVGIENNYTSFGGIVGGQSNEIDGTFNAILSGYANTTSHNQSAVLGGYDNTANADYASVSGGAYNTASSYNSSVSGGYSLTQSNFYGWTGGSYHTP